MAGRESGVNQEYLAKQTLSYFHNYALKMYSENYKMEFQGLLDALNSKTGTWLAHFGGAVMDSGLSDTELENAMKRVADTGKGLLPRHGQAFFDSLTKSTLESASWIEAITDSAKEVGEKLSSGVESAGGALKLTFGIAPFVLGAAVLLYVFTKAKSA